MTRIDGMLTKEILEGHETMIRAMGKEIRMIKQLMRELAEEIGELKE